MDLYVSRSSIFSICARLHRLSYDDTCPKSGDSSLECSDSSSHFPVKLDQLSCLRVCDLRPDYPTQLSEWFLTLSRSPVADLCIDYGTFHTYITNTVGDKAVLLASIKAPTLSWLEDNEFVRTFERVSIPHVEDIKLHPLQRDWSIIVKSFVCTMYPLLASRSRLDLRGGDLLRPRKKTQAVKRLWIEFDRGSFEDSSDRSPQQRRGDVARS